MLKATEKHFAQSHDKGTQTPHVFAVGRVNGECKARDLRSWKLRASDESARHPRVAFYLEDDDGESEGRIASPFYIHDYVWASVSNVYEAMGRFENLSAQGSLDECGGLTVVKQIAIPSSCTRDPR